jgi:hypothetical protein
MWPTRNTIYVGLWAYAVGMLPKNPYQFEIVELQSQPNRVTEPC